jgi:hypothetical protein
MILFVKIARNQCAGRGGWRFAGRTDQHFRNLRPDDLEEGRGDAPFRRSGWTMAKWRCCHGQYTKPLSNADPRERVNPLRFLIRIELAPVPQRSIHNRPSPIFGQCCERAVYCPSSSTQATRDGASIDASPTTHLTAPGQGLCPQAGIPNFQSLRSLQAGRYPTGLRPIRAQGTAPSRVASRHQFRRPQSNGERP